MYLRFLALAVATPILANDTLPGVTDRHFPTLPRPYWACVYSLVPSPIDQGTDPENVKLQLPGTNGMPLLCGLLLSC